MNWPWVALVVAVGGLLAIQPTLNAEVGRHVGGPVAAAVVNFSVGLLALVTLIMVMGGGALPGLLAVSHAPWWSLCGGLIGATFVAVGAFVAPRIGISVLVPTVIFGQLGMSLAVDQFGLFNQPVRDVSWSKVLGVLMTGGGVILVMQD